MERSRTGRRLIIVCGLPGSGKTTLAKELEGRLRAVRFSPDEWMDALSLDIYDEERRGKIEALQWKFAQELLALGLTVIIEWGTWGRTERDALRLGARALGAAVELHYLYMPADVVIESFCYTSGRPGVHTCNSTASLNHTGEESISICRVLQGIWLHSHKLLHLAQKA